MIHRNVIMYGIVRKDFFSFDGPIIAKKVYFMIQRLIGAAQMRKFDRIVRQEKRRRQRCADSHSKCTIWRRRNGDRWSASSRWIEGKSRANIPCIPMKKMKRLLEILPTMNWSWHRLQVLIHHASQNEDGKHSYLISTSSFWLQQIFFTRSRSL